MKNSQALLALVFIVSTITYTAAQEKDIALNRQQVKSISLNTSSNPLHGTSEAPGFDGGNEALAQYMREHIQYPDLARRKGVEGTVILQYYITKSGAIEDVKVVKSVGSGLDEEALRLAGNMPKWIPAIQNNMPKKVKYTLPITFQLD